MRKHCLCLPITHLQLCCLEPRALNLSSGVQAVDHISGPETEAGNQPPREWVRVQMWSPWEGQTYCGESPSVPSQSLLAPYSHGSPVLSVQLFWSMIVGRPSSGMKSDKERMSYKM